MKLKRGTKPIEVNIPDDVPYTLEQTGDYIEIEIKDPVQIAKLRTKGFTNV